MTQFLNRRQTLIAGAAAALAVPAIGPARAQAAKVIRLGVLTDLNGPYAGNTGKGSVVGTRLAAEDFMKAHPDIQVEVIQGDFQNKPDVGLAMARDWIDRQGIDAIVDVPVSSVALAVAGLVTDKDKVALFTGPATATLTGTACGPNHVHWTYDTWSLAAGTGRALVADGGDSWFFITADYAFGHALEGDTANFVRQAGGRVLGTVRTPFPGTTDFSSFLQQAKSSGAKIIGLANAGTDTVNCIKQAAEFGITRRGVRLAGLLFQLSDVHAVGLEAAQGLTLTEAFYWDMNEGTRAFSARVAPQLNGQKPSMIHAGGYSAVAHYLKGVAGLGYDASKASGRAVVDWMKATPTDDALFGQGQVRADGRKIHEMHLFQVKAPGESKHPWDYYKLVRSLPAADAFRPMSEGGCPLVRP
ncbi:amino acid/amide ABC transporter substrate-binding protein (HAAT family) [Humitalea rosea]|uniref:Amino acid/amide ABC transporter substrate-binding protein (HAAT family) n=1 Tax=Humitalea rosea TaxID=990373 RepID=A0A2W7I778_9PROT|nr:ABC transporter substrate-binding protein [Humitalea rosea]PZW42119.1 amino acid/amide ABC transporter substrate-binding protein (HAAT family) [Humitalea rosea]